MKNTWHILSFTGIQYSEIHQLFVTSVMCCSIYSLALLSSPVYIIVYIERVWEEGERECSNQFFFSHTFIQTHAYTSHSRHGTAVG